MIKILNCKNKNYINKLETLLNNRRKEKTNETKIVSKIIKDIKKREFIKFKVKSKHMDIIERKYIGSFLFPYLSPIPAKNGFEKSLINTEHDKIMAI